MGLLLQPHFFVLISVPIFVPIFTQKVAFEMKKSDMKRKNFSVRNQGKSVDMQGKSRNH